MSDRLYQPTVGFLFAGLGAGALGFLQAESRLGSDVGRFRNLGGVDIDPLACQDFEKLTGAKATQADLSKMTPAELRAAWGDEAPDCIFLSPPCKGFSRLLSIAQSESPKYQALNRLVLQGIWLALETWDKELDSKATGKGLPGAILLENVHGIASRGKELLLQVKQLLLQYGYVFHEAYHDCGEVGGLAQHRMRYLLLARHPAKVTGYIYRPPRKKVRGCGEVLGTLPLPNAKEAGPLHQLPKISDLTWVRLAYIPPGGDWRDLPRVGAAAPGEGTLRSETTFKGAPGLMGVLDWEEPAQTVTGSASVSGSNTPAAVADPRLLTSPLKPGQDRREVFKRHQLLDWKEPSWTVSGNGSNAVGGVADPRIHVKCRARAGAYGVLGWNAPSGTVTGSMEIDNSRAAVADPREVPEGYLRFTREEATARYLRGEPLLPKAAKPKKGEEAPAPLVPLIETEDGSWHRPMTILEMAALQGLPLALEGKPLSLAGNKAAAWRERIGNAVPVPAGKAMAETILTALVASEVGGWTVGEGGVWVREDGVTEDELNQPYYETEDALGA